MKKIITLVLALVLIFTMSVSVFATGANPGTGEVVVDNTDDSSAPTTVTKNNEVTITLSTDDVTPDTVYYVVLEWGNLAFSYKFTQKPTWNPEKHEYETSGAAGTWDGGDTNGVTRANAIIVANHSNVGVVVETDVEGAKSGITVALTTTDGETLERADTTERIAHYELADRVAYTINVSGNPTTNAQTKFNISVTIKPAA